MNTDWHEMLFESNPNPMLIYDLDTLAFLKVNDAAIHHYGYSREEFLDMTIKNILPPEDATLAFDSIDPDTERLDEVPGTCRHVKKDGSVIAVEIASHTITYKGRHAKIVMSKDITERIQFEGERVKLIHDFQEAMEKLETEVRDRKEAEDNLLLFNSLIQQTNDAIYIIEPRTGRLLDVNEKACMDLGYSRGELLSMRVPDIEAEFRDLISWEAHVSEVLASEHLILPGRHKRKNGTNFPVEVNVKYIAIDGKEYMVAVARDVTERKMTEEVLKASLREKEALLQEIHHRVKNNMQIVSSLLRLQSRLVKDPESLELFRESQNRIHSIALIHEKLYMSESLASIDFKDYTSILAQTLFNNYSVDTEQVTLDIDIHGISLNTDTAIPCGLIINELVSNSLKHAFPDNRRGTITISLTRNRADSYVLTVTDNGTGMPEETKRMKNDSLGLDMVAMLAEEQLHGKVEYDTSEGTRVTVTFREVKYKKRVR